MEATALQPPSMRELDDVLGIEVGGVRGEAGAGGVFDALIDGQDGQVAGAREAAGAEHALEVAENAVIAVAGDEDAIDEIRAGQMQRLLGDGLANVPQQAIGLGTQIFANGGRHEWRLSDVRSTVAVPRQGRTPPAGPRSEWMRSRWLCTIWSRCRPLIEQTRTQLRERSVRELKRPDPTR